MNVFELVAKIGLDTKEYTDQLDKASKATKTIGQQMTSGISKVSKFATKTFAVAGGAAVAFGAKAVSVGREFDASMSQVAATLGKTVDEMNTEVKSTDTSFGHFEGTLTEFAKYMGENTAFSAKQAADALNYMALAGYDTQKSMDMLPTVLNLAAAGNMDLARASDMVTDAQTAFGISSERTVQMVDEMAKAASTGNTSVEQLGDAFLIVGGLTKDLNGGMVTLADGTQKPVDGLQELEIALTAMANAGVKGSEAGTHMRNMLLKLSSPTKEGVKQMEALGVSVFDAGGQMRSLQDIFGDLNKAFENLTQEEKIQAISDLFNARDIASAEALLGAVEQDWNKIGESILNAEGAAQKMADTQLDNLEGDVTKLKSAFEGTQIALSEALTPALRDITQNATTWIGDLTQWIRDHSDEIAEKVKTVAHKVADAIKWVIDNFDKIKAVAITVAKALAGVWVVDKIIKFIGVVKGVIGFIKNVKDIVMGLVPVIKSLWSLLAANPVVLIIAGIVAAIAAIKLLWDNCAAFRDFIEGVFEFIKAGWENLVTSIEWVIEKIVGLFKGLVEFFIGAWENIQESAEFCVNAIGDFFTTAWELIKAVWNTVVGFFQGIWDGIVGVFTFVGETLSGFFQGAWDLIVGIWEGAGEWFEGIWKLIKLPFEKVGEFFSDAFEEAWKKVKEWMGKIKEFAEKVIDGIKTALENLKEGIKEVLGIKAEFTPASGGIVIPGKQHATGGVVRKGEIAILEGTGAEAVVPLDQNKKWIHAVAQEFQAQGSGTLAGAGGDIVIPVYIGDERIQDVVVKAQQLAQYRTGGR